MSFDGIIASYRDLAVEDIRSGSPPGGPVPSFGVGRVFATDEPLLPGRATALRRRAFGLG
ncbi:MAG TPA: hypothetical protein VMK12_19670 [Anaeromyxobacteraceae bacterium]|nr:hypothetical protein [Anaeromyxobacteraceae bacterium]